MTNVAEFELSTTPRAISLRWNSFIALVFFVIVVTAVKFEDVIYGYLPEALMTACFGIFVFLSVRALLEGNILQFDNAGWFFFALVTALIFKNSQDISRKV